jgi:hypothetical protein
MLLLTLISMVPGSAQLVLPQPNLLDVQTNPRTIKRNEMINLLNSS